MPNMPNLRRTKMVDVVFKILKGKILNGELKQCEKLPSQEKLAEQLGVSRTVIREAINKLTSFGLINCEQGRGSFITIPKTDAVFESVVELLSLDDNSNIELIEARYYLETAISRLAALRATKEDIDEMERIIDNLEKNAKSGDMQEWANADLSFHVKLGEAAGNRIIKAFLDSIRGVTFQYLLKLSNIPSEVDVSIQRHRAILEAVRQGDANLAEQKMKAHFDSVINVVSEYLYYDLNF